MHACVYVLSLYKKKSIVLNQVHVVHGPRLSSDQGSIAMAHEMVLVCL